MEQIKVRKTYSQEWSAYNQAQTNEKSKFQELLFELCSQMEEPIQHMGRPRVPLADRLFACCLKVYSMLSGRRFTSDLQEATRRGYLSVMPHYNSMFRYLESEDLTAILKQLIVESSGFCTGEYGQWLHAKYGAAKIINRENWLKVHLMCGVKTNIVTSVEVTARNAGDSPQFGPLVEQTSRNFVMNQVSADKAYSSSQNLSLVLVKEAQPFIAFRNNANAKNKGQSAVWKRMFHLYKYNEESFMQHYHKRSNVETTFSMIKAKFGERLRSKTETAQTNEVLCKILAHNLCCVIQGMYELGIEVDFSQE